MKWLQTINYKLLTEKKGFTLVELIIYMGLLTVLILVFTQIFTSILDNQSSSQSTSRVAEDGRYIYSRFIYDVNRAQSISIPAALGSSSANLVLTINSAQYTYSTNSGNLTVTDPTGTYALNGFGTTISNVNFQRIGNAGGKHTIQMNFTVTSNMGLHGAFENKSFQTTAGLR